MVVAIILLTVLAMTVTLANQNFAVKKYQYKEGLSLDDEM
jgi:hypothetical protein